MNLFPNPAREFVYIEGLMPEEEVTLFSSDGVRIWSAKASETGQLKLSLESLAAGTYIIRAGKQSARLLVK
ncbi:T9SS type A sorting domain-containing protein [Porphyromonas crevioricanis]|uniref:T9SS type A sorting domain-containing protein n=1 Tax=Porphyromonas crevioricanis TaxID=393921 RepID=UPI0021D0B00A|nr:T9SS type A sorting domain-containing protein [Porphyromonas crevioricanis]